MTLEFFFFPISNFKLSSHDHISCVVLDFFWVEASLHLHVVILRLDPSWKILSFLISNHKLNPGSSGLWLIYLMIKIVPTHFRNIYPCLFVLSLAQHHPSPHYRLTFPSLHILTLHSIITYSFYPSLIRPGGVLGD